MDPSALIFVALAVAWAAYLIPRALEFHEESARSRSIDKFSHGLRILARREPLNRRSSTLVTVADALPEPAPRLSAEEHRALLRAHRRAAGAAARRRRRIVDLLVVASLALAGVAIWGRVEWFWMAVPGGLVLLWLVVCRLSVRGERRRWSVLTTAPVASTPVPPVVEPAVAVDVASADPVVAEADEVALPAATGPQPRPGWDMLPFVVPTYVVKEQVRRSVRTIDLDSTGVWSSGRNDIDSALVRDSAAAAQADEDGQHLEQGEQALGS